MSAPTNDMSKTAPREYRVTAASASPRANASTPLRARSSRSGVVDSSAIGVTALLGEPSRPQRLAVIEIGAKVRHLAVEKLEDRPSRRIDPGAAAPSASFYPTEHEYAVVEITELLGKHSVLLPGVTDVH